MGISAATKAALGRHDHSAKSDRASEFAPLREPSQLGTLHALMGNRGVGQLLSSGISPPGLRLVDEALRTNGQPLHLAARVEMERRFGTDFGRVRVHADERAGRSARAVDARALTVGEHIIFDNSDLVSDSASSRMLLAHELAHVIQQRRGGSTMSPGSDAHSEAGARRASAALARPGQVEVIGASAVTLARAPAGERATDEEIRAYQLLRRLEEQAHIESGEIEERAVEKALPKRIAAEPARVKRKQAKLDKQALKTGKPAEKVEPMSEAELRKLIAGGSTAGVSYFVDDDGRLHKVVSGSGGRRRDLEFQDGTWVGAAGAKSKYEKHAERNTIRNAQSAVAGAQESTDHPPHLVLVTSGASRPHCARCAEKIRSAGGTTASEVNEPEEKQLRPGVTVRPKRARPQEFGPVLQSLQRVPPTPPPKPPEVVYRKPPKPGGTGGVGAPPAALAAPGAGGSSAKGSSAAAHSTPAAGTPHDVVSTGTAHQAPGAGGTDVPPVTSIAHPGPGKGNQLQAVGAGTHQAVQATVSGQPASSANKTHQRATAPSEAVGLPPPDTLPAAQRHPRPKQTTLNPPLGKATGQPVSDEQGAAAPSTTEGQPPPGAGAPAAVAGKTAPKSTGTSTATVPATHTPPPSTPAAGTRATTPPPAHVTQGLAHPPRVTNPPAQQASTSHALSPPSPADQGVVTHTGLGRGGLERTRTEGGVTNKTQIGGGGVERTRSDEGGSTTTHVGAGGLSRATTQQVKVDDVVASTRTERSLKRDKGQLGVGKATTKRFGQEDEAGNLLKGTERSTQTRAGVVSGPGGTGAFGSADVSNTTAYGKGYKTTQSIGVNGQFTVHVEPVPWKTPPEYQIVLEITLGGHVTAGGGVERSKGSVAGSVELQGSVSGTFKHTFSEEAKNRYLGALQAPDTGGADKEFRVLRLATGGSLDEAKQILATVGAAALSSQAVKQMRESDESDVTLRGGADVGVAAKAQGKTFGVGASVSLSKSGMLRRHVAIRNGKARITIEVLSESGYQAGGSVSAYGVEVGAGHGKSESTGESVTFELDPQSQADAQEIDRIGGIDSAAELRSFAEASRHVKSRTESHKTTTTNRGSVGFGGLEISASGEHIHATKVTTDESGVTKEYTGGTGGGLAVGSQGGPQLGFHQTSTVSLGAGPGNKGYGDVSTETTESDLGKSYQALKDAAAKKPVGTALGVATGGTPVIKQTTEVVGMKLNDNDFNALTAAAGSQKDWEQAFSASGSLVNQSLVNANALRHKVANLKGDRDAIAKAFADYAEDNDHAAEFVQKLVRPAKQLEGGIRYDWPEELSAERAKFEELILGDPVGEAETLATTSDEGIKQAVAQLKTHRTELDTLARKLRENRSKFTDEAALIEMQRRIGKRRSELSKEVDLIEPSLQHIPPKVQPDGAGRGSAAVPAANTADDAQEQAAAKQREAARLDDLARQADSKAQDLEGARQKEREAFAWIDSEYSYWYRKEDIYAIIARLNTMQGHDYTQWDQSVEDLRSILKDAGKDPSFADKYRPDRAGWKQRYDRANKL